MSKIFILSNFISTELYKLRFFQKQIVFTNGCFDIVHLGHLNYLKQARELGDCLVVGLNSDSSVAQLKGVNRPIHALENRARFLEYLPFVDYIIPFDALTPIELIQSISPDILVKGSDYKIEQIVGADWVISHGGIVKTIDYLEGFSTTAIINKLKS